MSSRPRPSMAVVAAVAGAALLLVGIGLPLVMTRWVQPPAGAQLASLDVRNGEPFELEFVSDGKAARIFLDMSCDGCSFPVSGELTASSGGKTLESAKIAAGRERAFTGAARKLEQQLVLEVPEQPAGAVIRVRGSLSVGSIRSNLSGAPVAGAPPPSVSLLRVTVAR